MDDMGVAASALHSTSDRDLVEALKALETKMRQDHSRMLAMVSELDARGVAASRGYSNTPALLVHTLRITRADARHRLAQAEVLHDTITPTGSAIEAELPQTAAALAQGDIGPDHVTVIHKTLKDLPHLEAEQRALAEKVMLERAAEDDPAALARFGWKVRDLVDPDGPPPVDNEPQRPDRELHRHMRRDGGMDFKGRLDATNAALLDALLVPFEKREADDDRGHAERAGDALVDVLKMAANCPDLPTHNGLKAEMTLTVSLDFLHNALDDTLLPGQSYLTARDARLAACDAHILPAVMDGDSKPLGHRSPRLRRPSPHPTRTRPARQRMRLPSMRPTNQHMRQPPHLLVAQRRPHPTRKPGPAMPPPPPTRAPQRLASQASQQHRMVHTTRLCRPTPKTQTQPPTPHHMNTTHTPASACPPAIHRKGARLTRQRTTLRPPCPLRSPLGPSHFGRRSPPAGHGLGHQVWPWHGWRES
jgi:uncharacterized protein DUF222